MQTTIKKHVEIERTPRVQQVCGMFDVPPSERSENEWEVDLPIEDRDWNIGLIVGASGEGKTTVARELFGDSMVASFDWSHDRSIVDDFPQESIKDIVAVLSSVGLSSPPTWLRPFRCLSNGEQFRAHIARAMSEPTESGVTVVDEFTSVVDRTVAKTASAAISKFVRRNQEKFVAVSCHSDIVEWLNPDWVFSPRTNTFQWRCERRDRPEIQLTISRVHRKAWGLFKHHHYLNASIHQMAACFIAVTDGVPCGFSSYIHAPGTGGGFIRGHRTVVLPDFQGVGIGNALENFVASLGSCVKDYRDTTSHPALIYSRTKSPLWRMTSRPSRGGTHGTNGVGLSATSSNRRSTCSFLWVGPRDYESARKFNLIS